MIQETQASATLKRGCALMLALGLLVPTGCLTFAWLLWGLSWWSGALAVGSLLLVAGLVARGLLRSALATRLLLIGAILVLAPWVLRAVWVSGSERARLTMLPGDTGARLVSRLYPEADGTLSAASLLALGGGLHDPEAVAFREILEHAYARTDPGAATFPTPAIATYLGLQSPAGFDTIIIQPPARHAPPDGAVVFLHGFAGNFYVYCWEFAQAAGASNVITLCPSMDATGAWWTERGAQTLDATLDYAHAIGMKRIYLAGLSNGAAGASVLALTRQSKLSGLMLISGLRAENPPSLPLLIVHGSTDTMMPTAYARAYAARSPLARYHEVPGGHFIFLSDHAKVRPAIAQFLAEIERGGAAAQH